MNMIFTFTIKAGAKLVNKATGVTLTAGVQPPITGELRGSGLYLADGYRVSAKDVTGLRRAA